MEISNVDFVEEYKRLDKFFLDAYPEEKGVTGYINRMKNLPDYSWRIPCWDYDLHMLVKLRNAKNRLSHEVGSFSNQMCTECDFAWLQDFYSRVLRAEDPLAILEKNRNAGRCRSNPAQVPQRKTYAALAQRPATPSTPVCRRSEPVKNDKSKKNSIALRIVVFEIVALIIVLGYIFITLLKHQ